MYVESEPVHTKTQGRAGVLSRDMDRTLASLGVDAAAWKRAFEPTVRNFDKVRQRSSAQAKALGDWLRSRRAKAPRSLVINSRP